MRKGLLKGIYGLHKLWNDISGKVWINLADSSATRFRATQ